MKAVAIKGVKEFEIKEIEKPHIEEDKILIEVTKCGICGSDIHYWEVGNPKGLVMGHEFCGKVSDALITSDFKTGDRVTALPISPCGHCEACKKGEPQYCPETWNHAVGLSLDNPGALTSTINVRSDMVIKVPDNVTDEEVAMIEPTAVGLHAIHLANIKVGDKVLVVGGGIIGLVSAMFAKMEGASYVAVSETNKARGEKSVELGVADEWFNALEQDAISKMSGEDFDVVIECCGNAPAVTTSLVVAKPGGTVVLVGVSLGTIDVPLTLAVTKELSLKGAIAYTKEEFETCIDLMSKKKINILKFVSEIVGLEDVQASYEKLTSGTSDVIKILVDPNK